VRGMKWFAAASCLSVLAISGPVWAGTNHPSATVAAQSGQNVSAEKIFSRKPFTANMVVNASDKTFRGKMYAGNHALRMELEVQPGMESTTIIRYDKKVLWVFMPGQKRYMEMPIGQRAGMVATLRNQETKYEIKDLGTEKVGQYACEKYQIHWSHNGHESNGLVWVASSGGVKGMIVRAQDETSGATTEYSNVQPGEPAASLFEVPAGYQKFDMPGMGGMPGIPHP
jgi:outer membrane lipoprotein-sorting protein